MNLASGMVISGVPSSVFIEMLFLSVFACSCLGVTGRDTPGWPSQTLYLRRPVRPFTYCVRLLSLPIEVLVEYHSEVFSAFGGGYDPLRECQWGSYLIASRVCEIDQG